MAKTTSKYTFQDIMTDLRRKSYSPVYFLMGEEPYYIDQIADYLQDSVLNETEKDFNLTVLYGRDVEIDTVINSAKRYPMMSEYQVIIIKEAQQIKNFDNLAFYLQNPLKSTILCFCYKYGKPDGRKKWFVELNKNFVVFESKKLYDNQVGPWIRDYLTGKNVKISEKAEVMLAEFLGTDLSRIVNEIDKLLLVKPADSHYITPELVEKNIGISKDFNVFELQDALMKRDVVKANRIIRYFAQNNKIYPLPMVLIQLFSFFSNLMIYHYLPDKSPAVVAAELKIHPFIAQNYVKAAAVFNAWKTMNIITSIRETDARGKGIGDTGTESEDLLKELIFKITH